MMAHSFYTPDRAICAALRRIDPGLSVDWWNGRWAVFHDLPHYGDVDASAAALAREAVRDFRDHGRVVSDDVCRIAAYRLIRNERLVCIVQEDDGGYRPLDGRLVAHLRRLEWQRRNWWVGDYLRVAHDQAAELHRDQAVAREQFWADLRQDIHRYVDRHHHSSALREVA